jgi:hypothetical protein
MICCFQSLKSLRHEQQAARALAMERANYQAQTINT